MDKVKRVVIIAAPNGAGKTTFARVFLAPMKDSIRFIKRRFKSGLELFHSHYKQTVNQWLLYDNSGDTKVLLEKGGSL